MLRKHPRAMMCLKQYSGINRGGQIGKKRVYAEREGPDSPYLSAAAEKKLYDDLQRAGVGTVLTIAHDGGDEMYRVTKLREGGENVLIPLNERAKDRLGEFEITSIPLSDRGMLEEFVSVYNWDNDWNNKAPRASVVRRGWTEQEAAENRDAYIAERQATDASKRQFRIKF